MRSNLASHCSYPTNAAVRDLADHLSTRIAARETHDYYSGIISKATIAVRQLVAQHSPLREHLPLVGPSLISSRLRELAAHWFGFRFAAKFFHKRLCRPMYEHNERVRLLELRRLQRRCNYFGLVRVAEEPRRLECEEPVTALLQPELPSSILPPRLAARYTACPLRRSGLMMRESAPVKAFVGRPSCDGPPKKLRFKKNVQFKESCSNAALKFPERLSLKKPSPIVLKNFGSLVISNNTGVRPRVAPRPTPPPLLCPSKKLAATSQRAKFGTVKIILTNQHLVKPKEPSDFRYAKTRESCRDSGGRR